MDVSLQVNVSGALANAVRADPLKAVLRASAAVRHHPAPGLGPAARPQVSRLARDLFDENGFDAVTIEEIAAAAEVSPSSVYRYFGTKEGLLVADEFDSMSQEALEGILDVDDPVGSLLQVVLKYEAAPEQASQPRTRRGFCLVIEKVCELHARNRGFAAALRSTFPTRWMSPQAWDSSAGTRSGRAADSRFHRHPGLSGPRVG